MRINKLILKKYNHYIYEYVGTDIRMYQLISRDAPKKCNSQKPQTKHKNSI